MRDSFYSSHSFESLGFTVDVIGTGFIFVPDSDILRE